jgi:hypothetical protein
MANITLQNGSDGLFDILNSIFELQTQDDAAVVLQRSMWDTVNSTFAAEFTSFDWVNALSSVEQRVDSAEVTPSAVVLATQSLADQAVIQKVDEAVNLVTKTLSSALAELVSQMIERNESLLLPSVAISVVADTGNTGDFFIVADKRTTRGDTNPQILDEVISVSAAISAGSSAPTVAITSDAAVSGLSPASFGGSALNAFLSFFSPSTGISGAGGLNSFTTSPSTLPGSWIASVGALGTAVLSAEPQDESIEITGSPSAGTYRITCTTTSLGTQSTGNLAYNATAAEIQAAIAAMSGFSRVSVSSTGTAPNYTHRIKFYGMRESVTLGDVNSTNTGSFTYLTVKAYTTPSLGSSALVLVSDGSTLVAVSHLMTHLLPRTAYAVNAWLAVNTASASGVIEISLTNGVGGTIIQDDAGNDLKYTINAPDLTATYQASAKLRKEGNTQAWTLAIAGTPTGGTYTITLNDSVNGSRTTAALAHDANAATVQAALRLLSGAGVNATIVTSSGSTPNFTHTIQFKGTAASITVTATSSLTGGTPSLTPTQTAAFSLVTPIFMMPTVLPASIYLRIRFSTTLPNTRKLYIENPVVGLATQLYTGGPFVGVFSGPVGAKDGDLWTITTTNNYAGKTSWAMERNFSLRERGLVIPHNSSPTITDFTPV